VFELKQSHYPNLQLTNIPKNVAIILFFGIPLDWGSGGGKKSLGDACGTLSGKPESILLSVVPDEGIPWLD
jgi:hypothetical protein